MENPITDVALQGRAVPSKSPEREKAESFFSRVAEPLDSVPPSRSIVITHLLKDRQPFLAGVQKVAPLAALLPKPKSIDPGARARLDPSIIVRELRRDVIQERGYAAALINECVRPSEPFALLDIGGYFAPLLDELSTGFRDRFLGVIEDTENGVKKYEALDDVPVPVVSVARSPLKNAEDHLVGQSIVFSVEALLREHGAIFQGRKATVIGYGKIGRSMASLLHARGVWTTVYDIDPIRRTEAMAHGLQALPTLEAALLDADLVLCATGNLSLSGPAFKLIREGAYITTVTSSDDELDLRSLRATYSEDRLDNHFTRYAVPGHHFYLLNKGNAVNFLHGAAVGPFINLVQGEILVALRELCARRLRGGIVELERLHRAAVAEIWLHYYGSSVR